MRKLVFGIFLPLISLLSCNGLNDGDVPNEYSEECFFSTPNDRFQWMSGSNFENSISFYVGNKADSSSEVCLTCSTYVFGKSGNCIAFVQVKSESCGITTLDSIENYKGWIFPKEYPTYYLLDFRTGKNILFGPYKLKDFIPFCKKTKVTQELLEQIEKDEADWDWRVIWYT